MKLSIIIVNYRAWADLDRCLASLTKDDWPFKVEIVVVDNQSADGIFETFSKQHPTVRFDQNPENSGFAAGCNRGESKSHGEYLLFLNPDTIASPKAICDLISTAEAKPEIGILSCRQTDINGKLRKSFDNFPTILASLPLAKQIQRLLQPRKHPNPRQEHRGLVQNDWVSGSLILIKKCFFQELGGWSEAYWMYYEDMDLCKRCHAAGKQVATSFQHSIIHRHGGASRGSEETTILTKAHVIRSRRVFISRHYSGAERSILLGTTIVKRIVPLMIADVINSASFSTLRFLRIRSGIYRQLKKF